MNDHKLLINNPKLTAYALGELDGFERASIEAALRSDPAARAAVEEIRAMSAQLEGALAMEATAEVKPAAATKPSLARAAIIPGRDRSKLDGGTLHPFNDRFAPLAKVIRFPQFYYVAGGLAAACFALMVALRTPKPPAPRTMVTELTFAPAPPAANGSADASSVAATEKDQSAGAAASASGMVSPAPVVSVDVAQATPTTTGLLNGNLSLLAQAKDSRRDASVPGAPWAENATLKNEAWAGTVARSEALVVNGVGTLMLAGSRAAQVAVAAPPLRAQLAVTGQPAPAADKIVMKASGGGAGKAGFASSSLLDQAQKQSGTAAVDGGGLFTYARISKASDGSLASNSRDRGMIFSENRGLSGYFATDLDQVAPAMVGARVNANTDRYAEVHDNDFLNAAQNELSTFGIDVDTASYSNVRQFLRSHQRPPRDAVRIEEFVNYFPYRYAPPVSNVPFAASLEVANAPWSPTHRLVRIGLKGREVSAATRPAANLVFLLDVSGSMDAPNRLPLVKESMRLLVGKLRADDRVAIVTYAGQSGLALESTPVSKSKDILDALDRLNPSGSTNGSQGIQLAYEIAKANFVAGGINRVILCTDGDFNVGVTGEGELARLVEEKAKSGVALTALAFGRGNLKDATLEKLADRGNGNYGYIDSRKEAEKLLVEQVNGTLMTIAKDVKIQVDFNPARVASYRLIGYENRLLKKEDFRNDAVDAGEIGAGHSVTAFYEIVPVGGEDKASAPSGVDELKYQRPASRVAGEASQELLTVKLRYKEPTADASQQIEFPLTDSGAKFADATTDFRFAAAVASFGMILRESPYKGAATMADVVAWAESGTTDDVGGYRSEFIELARGAEKLLR